ncbi:Spy/CpxP family protein refolding chaperone [Stieleria magnilauensis]
MKNMGSMKSMSQDANDSSESGGMSMGSGGMGMGTMGGMKNMSQDSGSQSSGMGKGMMSKGMGGMGTMSMMKGKKGMMGMGMMGMNPAMKSDSMAGMEMPSALPGFPGASHLYHIGQTGFFLDHPEHITLTDQQQKKLNTIKESSLLATSTSERKIAEAEQELWVLTAADQPDISKIEAKVKEIASLTVNNRIEFIRAVGNAADILTEDQRQTLVGIATDNN